MSYMLAGTDFDNVMPFNWCQAITYCKQEYKWSLWGKISNDITVLFAIFHNVRQLKLQMGFNEISVLGDFPNMFYISTAPRS